MNDWHDVFKFFVNDLGVPQSEVCCRVQKPYSISPTEYEIQVYDETVILYDDSGSFWIPNFIEIKTPEGETSIDVLGVIKCKGHWKKEFMKILPTFNKYIRQ